MNKEEFLQQLDREFARLAPSSENKLIQSTGQLDNDYATVNDWYAVSRDHNHQSSKPEFPPIGGFSRATTVKTATAGRRKHDAIENKRNYQGPDSSNCNLSKASHEGWMLSKGWKRRPKAVQVNAKTVLNNINIFAERYQKGKHKTGIMSRKSHAETIIQEESFQRSLDLDEDSRISSKPDCGVYYYYKSEAGQQKKALECKKAIIDIARNSMKTLGPKYQTRPPNDRREVFKTSPSQRSDYTRKDITFGYSKSLRSPPSYSATGSLGSYGPSNNSIERTNLGTPKLDSQGKQFLNSIYYDEFNSPSPGPVYSVQESWERSTFSHPFMTIDISPHPPVINLKNDGDIVLKPVGLHDSSSVLS